LGGGGLGEEALGDAFQHEAMEPIEGREREEGDPGFRRQDGSRCNGNPALLTED